MYRVIWLANILYIQEPLDMKKRRFIMYEQIVSRDEEAILFHTPPLIEKKYKLNKSGRTITAFL